MRTQKLGTSDIRFLGGKMEENSFFFGGKGVVTNKPKLCIFWKHGIMDKKIQACLIDGYF